MVDVLVTHSYHLAFDPKQLRKMQPYPPLATLYAATALRDRGISVAVFDSMLEEPTRGFDRALDEHRPRIVVVYEDDFNFLSKMCLTRMREVAWGMAAAARALGAITIVHGSDATDHTELFLRNGFDYVCRGEAEQTLVKVCGAILGEAEVPDADGMARLNAAGRMVESGTRLAKNPRWAELSFAAQDLIDLEPYRRAWSDAHGYFSVNMVSSRGCPYHCNWCAKPISGNQFHLRPAAAVATEMKLLKDQAGAEHIWFGDDIFALDHGWMGEFAEEVTKRDARIPFKIQSRANLMTERTVEHLRVAGCTEVWMGVESGSQAVLDLMDKGLNLAAVRSARARLKSAGIRACYFLQLGYPGEAWPELLQTVAFVRETRPDDIGVSFSYPLPGTVFYESVREQLGMKRNWNDSDDLCIMFKAAYKTELYRAVRDALHAEVDSWSATPDKIDSAGLRAKWRRIYEMEQESRNPDAFTSSHQMIPLASSSFVPIEELAPARSI
jgi:anaerobic magnesium-protoporphyrin IX monomethyl ester cyclase